MVGCGEGDIVLEEVGQFSCEGQGKLWSSIGDHFGVETELRKNIGEEELGRSFGINVFCAGAVNYPLCKAMVYHDHDRIISVGIGESRDEIYRYRGEWKGAFDSQRGESGYRGVCVHLGHLAVSISQDELAEEGRHSWSPIVPLQLVKSLEEPFMPSGRGLVERSH